MVDSDSSLMQMEILLGKIVIAQKLLALQNSGCGNDAPISAQQMLGEVSRLLKHGGVYILITYGDPKVRMPHLSRPMYDWSTVLCIQRKWNCMSCHFNSSFSSCSNMFSFICSNFYKWFCFHIVIQLYLLIYGEFSYCISSCFLLLVATVYILFVSIG